MRHGNGDCAWLLDSEVSSRFLEGRNDCLKGCALVDIKVRALQ